MLNLCSTSRRTLILNSIGTIFAYQDDNIYARYNPRAFVGREWLIEEVGRLREDKSRRHLIIVGEPGSGKSHFMAYLAYKLNCPHHFIRLDNIGGGITGVDAHNFLISIAQQLYQKYGQDIFSTNMVETVKVAVEVTRDQAEIVGQFIEELYTLPFLPTSHSNIEVWVRTAADRSRTVGQHIKRLYDTTYSLPASTLLHATIISPLKKLQELYPKERVLILIDALDEALSYTSQSLIIDIIPRATEADYPGNLCLVMTSRRGSHLSKFLADNLLYLDEKDNDHKKKGYRYRQANLRDAHNYIHDRLAKEPLSKITSLCPQDEITTFISRVESNGDGNFLYLYHFFNEVERIVSTNSIDLQKIIVPKDLDDIYRVFAVNKIKESTMDFIRFAIEGTITDIWITRWQDMKGVHQVKVSGQNVSLMVEESNKVMGLLLSALSGTTDIRIDYRSLNIYQGKGRNAWEENYLPLLGILSVIQEPVSKEELAGFSSVSIAYVDAFIEQISQYLEVIEEMQTNRYRLYHSSFREYLLDKTRNRDFTLDASEFHRKIVALYRQNYTSWDEVDWSKTSSLYVFHSLAFHLVALREFEDLYALVVGGKDQLKWFEAHFRAEASYVGYLRDLDLIWDWVTRKNSWDLSRQMRYVLISSSIYSLVGNILPQLLPRFIQTGRLAPGTALEYIKRIPNQYQHQRAKALKLVVSFLVLPEFLQEALRIGTTIADDASINAKERIDTLCAVIQYLPSELQAAPLQLLWNLLQELTDLKYLIEKVAPFWKLLPEQVQSYVFQKLKSMKNEALLADALIKLFPFIFPEQKSEALTLMSNLTDKHLYIVSQAKISQYVTDEQKQQILSLFLIIDTNTSTYLIALVSLYPLLSEEQKLLAIERAWILLQRIMRTHYEFAINQLCQIAEFMTEVQTKEAVTFMWNDTPFTFPYNLLKAKALFQLTKNLSGAQQEQAKKQVHRLVQMAINSAEKSKAQVKHNFSILIKFLQYFSKEQQQQVIRLADAITDEYERAFTLLEIVELDLLQHLFTPLRDELISTIELLTQRINDEREWITVLAVLAKYTPEAVRAAVLQDIARLEDLALDQQSQALIWLSLATYFPDHKQAEIVNKAVELMRPLMMLDELAGKLIDYLPNTLLQRINLPADIQIHLDDRLIVERKEQENVSEIAANVKQVSRKQKIDTICILLEALKKGEYSNKETETILANIINSNERIAFFDDERHMKTWCEALQALATCQRKDCLQSLAIFLPLFLYVSTDTAENREINSVVYELLQTLHDVERWWH